MLFDPYGGTNPKFSDATAYNGPNKSVPQASANPPNRSRKVSNATIRSGYGQIATDQAGNPSVNRARQPDATFIRAHGVDDPAITGDPHSGCNQFWVGPENKDVIELFVGDLPEDIQPCELHQLFEELVGISPTRIMIKPPREGQESHSRWHAFVMFSTPSDAKKALQIRNHNPFIRDGSIAVSVTVPKRYYQKIASNIRKASITSGSFRNPSYSNRMDEREQRRATHASSQVDESAEGTQHGQHEKPIYSPQDARSDLHKKTPKRSGSNDLTTSGSPEIHRPKTRQSLPADANIVETGSPAVLNTKEEKERTENSNGGEMVQPMPVTAGKTTTASRPQSTENLDEVSDKPSDSVTVKRCRESALPADTPGGVSNGADVSGNDPALSLESREPLMPSKFEDDEKIKTQPVSAPSHVEKKTPKIKILSKPAKADLAARPTLAETEKIESEQTDNGTAFPASTLAQTTLLSDENHSENRDPPAKTFLDECENAEPRSEQDSEPQSSDPNCTVQVLPTTEPTIAESIFLSQTQAQTAPPNPQSSCSNNSGDPLSETRASTVSNNLEGTTSPPHASLTVPSSKCRF